ncbi:MAG: 3D domain-containing protein [Acidobacteriota bacterium]|nr:3D domain-containing protein [Acidobacteriota bacterium]
MENLARGSLFLGLIVALFAVLFYFQPTAEAKNAFNIAIDSQENRQQETIQETNQKIQQSDNQTTIKESLDESNENGEIVLEAKNFRATAYCLKGRTATGGSVRRGIVAADPRVLPLGTRIQLNAGSYSGTYTVADTGGSVKGRILDIWVPSCSEAMRFGRRSIQVSVLGKGKKDKT